MDAIQVAGLTKRYGDRTAVEDLSFSVAQGRIAGFLGPNGSGKTTTLRMLLGLIAPTSGSATFWGRTYLELPGPATRVGALLDSAGFHPGRSARSHLLMQAAAIGAKEDRIDEVLVEVGLAGDARRAVKTYSLGMRQRLGLATALLGRPSVLVLDEPANGLDPEGIRWLRNLLRKFARDGGSVLVSSHLLSEVAELADSVVMIAKGRLLAAGPLAEISSGSDSLEDKYMSLIDGAGAKGAT